MALATQARPPAPPTLNEVFEAEQGLVGLILAEPAVYGRIAALLRDADWTQNLHRGVFEVVGRFLAEGRPVSLDTVLPRVSDVAPDGAPADLYLAALAARAPASARAESLARLLAEAADARTGPDHLDRDLYAWAYEQALALRRGQFPALDALNLAEEIEDLGGVIYNRMESALRITLMHLLKWDHQPEKRTRSWHLSIRNGRLDVEDVLERHPSLNRRVPGAVAKAYRRARIDASGETGLDESVFPAECPYDRESIMTRPVPWPPASGES
ncbi:DUF29 family protein [Methylobacterium sp. Leaf456]|uniref:DUF29 family protein n=1 Tax=Methylobacterium sp. Leaf456 TaxID=1736382 RepID=UPI000AA355A6|nr:DUF29 family protein [Methylobacterium sp. Leaf456]